MRDKPNLLTVYEVTNLYSNGIFDDLWNIVSDEQSVYIAPWLPREDIAASLDRYYYFVHSGDKTASMLLRRNFVDGHISDAHREIIAKMFLDTYGHQLNRLWGDYVKEYDPLQSYDVTEKTDYGHEADGTVTDDGSSSFEKTGSELTRSLEIDDKNSIYGFDSGEREPVGSDATHEGERIGVATYGKKTSGNGQVETPDRRIDTEGHYTLKTSHDESTDDLTTHKYGTLGTQPVAEILNKEIEVWMWNFYLKCLFPFLDRMLTVPIMRVNL